MNQKFKTILLWGVLIFLFVMVVVEQVGSVRFSSATSLTFGVLAICLFGINNIRRNLCPPPGLGWLLPFVRGRP